MAGRPGGISAVADSEQLILRAFGVIRVVTLVQLAVVTGANWGLFRYPGAVVALAGVAVVESAFVLRLGWARGSVAGWSLPLVDVGVNSTLLAAMNVLMEPSANPYTVNVLYPYSVSSMLLAGFAVPRLVGILLIPAAITGVYSASTVAWFRYDILLPQNSLSYWAFAVIAWLVSGHYRQLSRALDEARAEAVERAAELAEERERGRMAQEREDTYRNLHDGVLQTLEALRRSGEVADPMTRSRVAQDSAWLRRLISDEPGASHGDLVAALGEVQQEFAGRGLAVELNTAGAGGNTLPPGRVTAVAGAVREALTNVLKHADTDRAVVRAWCDGGALHVTVLDHGRGFDPECTPPGVGLTRCVLARLRESGGTARVESAPGDGSRVHLRLPIASGQASGRPANTGRAVPRPAPAESVDP